MKQFKFLMVALTLLLGVTLTSCLDSSDNTPPYAGIIGRCISSYPPTFMTTDGKQLILSGSSTTFTEGGIYSFYYTVPEGQSTEDASYTVTLYNGNEPIQYNAKANEGPFNAAYMPTTANAPLYVLSGSINLNGYSSSVDPAIYTFGSYSYLFVTPFFWYKSESTQDAMTKEIAKHAIVVTYDLADLEAGDTELVLTVNHVISDSDTETVTRNVWGYITGKAYNLSEAMSAFESKTGNKPTRIRVEAQTNSQSNSLMATEGATTQSWTYTFK